MKIGGVQMNTNDIGKKITTPEDLLIPKSFNSILSQALSLKA